MSDWSVYYKGCYNDDGSLLFPERLTQEFLDSAKKHMGTQFWSNQYMNQVIDESLKPFKPQWLKYYDSIPKNVFRFTFVDPAISLSDSADFTGCVVIAVDSKKHWYIEHAAKYKITPTKIIDLLFALYDRYAPMCMGIEDVAFQKVLLYMAHEQMLKRQKYLPLEGIRPPTDKTKHAKILGLVPRFEWGDVSINKGLTDFEEQYLNYAGERSAHDDIVDALASIEPIVKYPDHEVFNPPKVHPQEQGYEQWYIHQLASGKNPRQSQE